MHDIPAVQLVVFDFNASLSTGDGKFYFHIDPSLGGNDLIDVHAEVITAGTTGNTDIQIHNVTQAASLATAGGSTIPPPTAPQESG